MLFLAMPDDDVLGEETKEKALLDTEELAGDDFVPEASKDKVELDLEDAPFLEEEEEEEEPQAAADEESAPILEAPPKGLKNLLQEHRKIVLIAGSAGALLLILLMVLILLPGGEPEPVPEIPDQVEPTEGPVEETVEEPEEIPISWEPFWVELQAEDGEVRFLYCEFSSTTTDNLLAREILQKNVVLRDAIFYYLRNKDMTFLTDENNAEALKEGLLGALNNHLSSGKLNVLLIEEYLVK